MKASTTLRNNMMKDKGFAEIMQTTGMFLAIYGGTVPATADAAVTGATHLCTISAADVLDDSLTFETDAVAGVLSKLSGETWSGTVYASGTATFFRLIGGYATEYSGGAAGTEGAPAGTSALKAMIDGTASNVIQGTVGVSGADLNLVSPALVAATTQTIEYFVVSFPTD